jgi:hypothetical protein
MTRRRKTVLPLLSAAVLALAWAADTATAQGPTPSPQVSPDHTRHQGMDANGDGVITREEWRGNDQSFRQQDTNGDGRLSGDEVVPPGQGRKMASPSPSTLPSASPTMKPSASPTTKPSASPTIAPSAAPTPRPDPRPRPGASPDDRPSPKGPRPSPPVGG